MALSYEYAVLTAIPNARRGERVNVGIIVFRLDRIDVRLKHGEYKLRALTGENWGLRLHDAQAALEQLATQRLTAQEALRQVPFLEPLLQPAGLGWLRASTEAEYEASVDQILASLVTLPKRERPETKTRINTEIMQAFRKAGVLAKGDESIEDHKVVREFAIDSNEGLIADFALKNGKITVTSTLDLRKQTSNLAEAALKSITLDKAAKKYHGAVRTVGVYAVDREMKDNFNGHISMLGDYAEDLYDWSDINEQLRFKRSVFDALKIASSDLLG